jgi:hypothetical protein
VQARQHNRGYPAPYERQPEEDLRWLQRLAEREVPRGTWRATTLPNSATNSGEHSRTLQNHGIPTTRKARKKPTKATATSKSRFADDRRDAIKKELAKLLVAGFIREVFHPEWFANPVLVRKKSSNEWRMCVDYTDLNKHCPKDPFGLPRIDQVIDSTAGCDLLCFLDCYSGYHQIAIKEEDQEKTVFITPFGAYCNTTMSFGLKNTGATYQRAIQKCFKAQLNKNVEAYVDDVVVKTKNSDTLIADLEETFASLREYRWKLNPNKCVFGVPSGKLLGFIISHRGIKANPEKMSAITNMKAPTCIKDVQKLTGCMTALNRFISKLGERGLPFFKLSSIKSSLRGLQRQTKPLLSSRTSYPSHQSSRLLAKRSSYCSTSL